LATKLVLGILLDLSLAYFTVCVSVAVSWLFGWSFKLIC